MSQGVVQGGRLHVGAGGELSCGVGAALTKPSSPHFKRRPTRVLIFYYSLYSTAQRPINPLFGMHL